MSSRSCYVYRCLLIFVVSSVLVGGCRSADFEEVLPDRMIDDSESFDLQGHRGARGLMPENSIPGFLRALELGVTTLEMDIVISADSQVVVSHEPWFARRICLKPSGKRIDRRSQRSFRIFEMTYDEIAAYDCGSRGNPDFPEQKTLKVSKPLLRDVLASAEQYARDEGMSPVKYNIETKTRPRWDSKFHPEPKTVVRLLYGVLEENEILSRATIQSFDMRTLRIAREMNSSLSLSLLIGRQNRRSVQGNIDVLGFIPDIYSPNYRLVDKELVGTAHERGMKVIPWTVNKLKTMRRLKSMGIDGLITDYPDRGRTLLQ